MLTAKAILWLISDAEARRYGEQSGLDTRLVHTVNHAVFLFGRQKTHP
jgi:hypothetical protein